MTSSNFQSIPQFLDAGFPALWLTTHEPEQTQASLISLLDPAQFSFCSWDCASGFKELATEVASPFDPKSLNPLFPLSADSAVRKQDESNRVVFLHNYHRFLDSPAVVQALYNAILRGESQGVCYCVLTPSPPSSLPAELSKAFTAFDYPLPTAGEIKATAADLLSSADLPQEVPSSIPPAALGLTRRELRNTLSLSLVRHHALDPATVLELKAQEVAKSGILKIIQHGAQDSFSSLAGMEGAKALITRLCSPNPRGINAKGILLVGAPGAGKSALARAAGHATNRTVLRLDMGSLLHKHVGTSEEHLRTALAVAEATAPNILQIEEVEKSFAGHSAEGDSGVMRRMFGHMLTWMEERTAPVFLIATSNDVSALPPEFLRAGRWSCEVFVDLPTPLERKAIWALYLKHYLVPDSPDGIDDDGWTGGEIKQACELACLLQIPLADAARKVRITSRIRKDQLESLRDYAERGGVLCASTGEPYTRPKQQTQAPSKAPATRSLNLPRKPPKESNN